MSTLFALDTRHHSDIAPIPTETTPIHPCFGGKGTFVYSHPPNTHSEIVEATGPYGDTVQTIQARVGAGFAITDIPIQPTKNYRFTVWVKRTGGPYPSHVSRQMPVHPAFPHLLFGVDGSCVTTLRGDNVHDGWMSGWTFCPPYDEWILMVGYVHSRRSFRSLCSGGSYFGRSKQLYMSLVDFKQKVVCVPENAVAMSTSTTTASAPTCGQQFRMGVHARMPGGNTSVPVHEQQVIHWFYPRVDEITGDEVSVEELLRGYGYHLFVRELNLHPDVPYASDEEDTNEHSSSPPLNGEIGNIGNMEECTTPPPCSDSDQNDPSEPSESSEPSNDTCLITTQERNQLHVALDKLCEIDNMLERYVTVDTIEEKLRFIDLDIGEIQAIESTVVKRDPDATIFAKRIRAELVEATVIMSTSDRRVKRHVQDDSLGLAFIELLRPVRYQKMCMFQNSTSVDANPVDSADRVNGQPTSATTEPLIQYEDHYQTGLIAQEVEAALRQLGREWSGHCVQSNGIQGIQYGMLTVPLVNAVKELSQRNRKLEKKVQCLEHRLNSMVRGLIGHA
mgnify:CR=1 FL=1